MTDVQKDVRLDNEGLWTDQRSAITVSSGARVDPLHPLISELHISDIAHSLARTCRYNGHVGFFYTVARHSLFVTDYIRDVLGLGASAQMQGLLHDCAEAYLGDLVRPLKHGPSIGKGYLEAEAVLEGRLALTFDLVYPWPDYVAQADNFVLLEQELSGPCYRWTWDSSPVEDEREFLTRFRVLVGARREEAAA